MVKYPQQLDGDADLFEVKNEVDDIMAEHHNALKEAVKALEAKVGVDLSAISTSLDYIVSQLAVKSQPPSGYHKVYEIYGQKEGEKYHPIIIYETEPEQ